MKSRCCVSIQIVLFQLLLFWWAYCSLFPWHPAAIWQLLVFTSIKGGREGVGRGEDGGPLPLSPSPPFSPSFSDQKIGRTRQRNTRYNWSDQKTPICAQLVGSRWASPKISVWIPKQETCEHSLLLVSSLLFHAGLKLQQTAQWSSSHRPNVHGHAKHRHKAML